MKNKKNPLLDEESEKKERICQKILADADALERELNEDPFLEDVAATPEMFADIMRRITLEDEIAAAQAGTETMEHTASEHADTTTAQTDAEIAGDAGSPAASAPHLSEEDKKALEIGRKTIRYQKRTKRLRTAGIVAAAMVFLFGITMTSEANRIKLLNAWFELSGNEKKVHIDSVERFNGIDEAELEARDEIREQLQIVVPEFVYIPKGLRYQNYTINAAAKTASMFYEYQDTVLTVYVKGDVRETVYGIKFDGQILRIDTVSTMFGEVELTEIEGPEGERDYVAELEYNNCYYAIYGIMPRKQFIKMIENIHFC